MRSVLTLASVALISAPSALAQETVTFSFEFDHAVLQPGQAQGIRVYAHFEPGVGAYVPWNTNGGTGQFCRVNSFAVAQFNILNVMNAQTGTWSNMYRNPFMLGTTGQVQPSGSVTGIWVFQPGGTYTIANPILLWGGTWTPSSYDPREVRLGTHSNAPPQVFLDVGISSPELDDWTPIEGEGSFQVVPAPGGIGALVAAVFFAGCRRRQGSDHRDHRVRYGAGSRAASYIRKYR